MYRSFGGVSRWYKMAGVSGVRMPGVVAAAAALATAATSVGFTDKLHPVVSPILFYAANPALLPSASSSSVALSSSVPSFPSGSCCLRSASGNVSADSWSVGDSNCNPATASVHSSLTLASRLSPLGRSLGLSSTSSVTETSPLARGCHCLSFAQMSSPSPLRPPYLYSTLKLPADELHRRFKGFTSNSVPKSSFAEFVDSSPAVTPSWSLNSVSFDTFDLSSHLASFFSSAAAPPSHPYASVVPWKSLHTWYTPISGPRSPAEEDGKSPSTKPVLTVVLLGWLGSQQKHLKKYAEWYNARGIQAVTFTLPMSDILSISMGGKVEEHVEKLTNQLSTWLAEESKGGKGVERQLIFHTFSNTGWLTYGVVLEKMSSSGHDWVDRIKGCVVDSAPAAEPDPHVWASGFSAALLKKRSSASNGVVPRDSGIADSRHKLVVKTSKPHVAESALLALLEKFFRVFLKIPAIHQRLSQVITVLSREQPPCPQLYIYSTADKVIPVDLVESFMEKQRQQGRDVRGCNFQSSPHVDHFRSFPDIYSKQVGNFLQECLHVSSLK